MTPQVGVYGVWRVATIAQKVVCSSVDYFATLVVNNLILGACCNKTARDARQVCWVKYSTTRC